MDVQPLGGVIGARITDVDLAALADDDLCRVQDALAEHLVVFLPNQHLDDDAHVALVQRLGSPYLHPLARARGVTEARAEHIVDDEEHPPFQDQWHTDVSWDPAPPSYGMLRAIDMPERGGDTIWASTYAAYDTLSPTMKEMLEGLTAFHDMPGFAAIVLHGLYPVAGGGAALAEALDKLRHEVSDAIASGVRIIVLSDRDSTEDLAPIPSLLMTSAVHHHLIREKTRTQVGLVIESGDAREVHHMSYVTPMM